MSEHFDHFKALDDLFASAQEDGKILANIVDDLRGSITSALIVLPGRWRDAEPARKILRDALDRSTEDIKALEDRPIPGDDQWP